MKKFFLAVASLFTFIGIASADNDRIISFEQLPAKSQEFIKKYFPDEKVSYVKEESDFMELSYEAVLATGTKIEFVGSGEWKEVNSYAGVPTSIVPKQVMNFLKKNQYMGNGVTVRKIERERSGWKVELSNNMEFEFDKSFQLRDIDRD